MAITTNSTATSTALLPAMSSPSPTSEIPTLVR
jgi:hypothetical protein